MTGSWALLGFGMFSVIEKATGLWVGRLGPWMPEGWPGSEVGWGLHPDAWGKGYGVEGSIAAIDWCFDVLGWSEVIHTIDPENRPSQKLAERLGSRVLYQTKLPPPFDHLTVDAWGQSRDEWRSRRR
jgi:RimJ/RimL family protein N-acetyltransferase